VETAAETQADPTNNNPFTGEISGGWGYVGAAYGISLSLLLAYTVVVTVRLRGAAQRSAR
jgi:hypothetical protein